MIGPIVIISPELKPGRGGVGDHTLRLIEKWSPHENRISVLAPCGSWDPGADLPVEVENLAVESSAIRSQLLRGAKLFLQYSAYGYSRFGYPRRLIRAVVDWKRQTGGRLVILFHEIWSFHTLPNKNAPIQYLHRRGIQRLLEAADAAFTTTRSQVEHLAKLHPPRPVHLLPVGSNIRPPRELKRNRQQGTAVLFGLQPARIRTLEKMKENLRRLVAAGRIVRVITVGAGSPNRDAEEAEHLRELGLGGGFEQRGLQDESSISELLTTASFGISGQDELSYEKSGSFMAYAAHELNVLNKCVDKAQEEPLCWLIEPDELLRGVSGNDLQNRAARLRDWQQRISSWDVIAARLGEALQLNSESCAAPRSLAAP
jgi:GNAT superfamily N-acetyltransferase